MVSTDYDERSISSITLALFEDSGWYKANSNYTGGLFRFGKNEGCSFLSDLCIVNEQTNHPREYCIESRKSECFAGQIEKGYCYLMTGIQNIPTQYQYFSDKTKGRYLQADYCPIKLEGNSRIESYFAENCRVGKNDTFPTSLEEKIGNNSICVESSLTRKDDPSSSQYKGKYRAICHEVECNYTTKTFTVIVGNATIKCDEYGSKVFHDDFDGNIICPDYDRVCTGDVFCNELFSCLGIDVTKEPEKDSSSFCKLSMFAILLLSIIL